MAGVYQAPAQDRGAVGEVPLLTGVLGPSVDGLHSYWIESEIREVVAETA